MVREIDRKVARGFHGLLGWYLKREPGRSRGARLRALALTLIAFPLMERRDDYSVARLFESELSAEDRAHVLDSFARHASRGRRALGWALGAILFAAVVWTTSGMGRW